MVVLKASGEESVKPSGERRRTRDIDRHIRCHNLTTLGLTYAEFTPRGVSSGNRTSS